MKGGERAELMGWNREAFWCQWIKGKPNMLSWKGSNVNTEIQVFTPNWGSFYLVSKYFGSQQFSVDGSIFFQNICKDELDSPNTHQKEILCSFPLFVLRDPQKSNPFPNSQVTLPSPFLILRVINWFSLPFLKHKICQTDHFIYDSKHWTNV